jgi:hypothetical protein
VSASGGIPLDFTAIANSIGPHGAIKTKQPSEDQIRSSAAEKLPHPIRAGRFWVGGGR